MSFVLSRSDASASALIQELLSASASGARATAASNLASFVLKNGLPSLAVNNINEELVAALKGKDAVARESALVGFEELFRKVGLAGGADCFFVPVLAHIVDRFQESGKQASIAAAAEKAAKQLIRLSPAELAPLVIEELFAVIESSSAKWKSKVGALDLIATFATSAREQVAERLGSYVPRLSGSMRDTKSEVSNHTNARPAPAAHVRASPALDCG